jgi:hypothetical protein
MNALTSRSRVGLDGWIDLHPLRVLGLILLLALILNAAKLWIIPPTLDTGDAQQWWDLALDVSHGLGYVRCFPSYFPFCGPANQVTAAREPAPVLLIAMVASLTRQSIYAVGLAQLVINLLILLGIFCLTRELADARVALLAAFLWVFYVPAIEAVAEIGGDLLATLGVTWGLYFFMRGRRTKHARDWLAAGVCVGFGALSRSAVLIVAPALMLGWVLRQHPTSHPIQSQIARLRAPVLFAIAVGITLLPWGARDYAVFGRPVIGTTLVGYNLFRYNYSLPTENYLHYVGPSEAKLAIQALLARRTDLRGTENEAQMDAVYRDEAVRIIAANPLRYTLLSGYRFLMLWFDWKVDEAYGLVTNATDYFVMAEQLLLLVMVVVGLRKWQSTWPLLVSIVTLVLCYMMVVGRLRYALPVMPLTVSLGALGVAQVGQGLRLTLNDKP